MINIGICDDNRNDIEKIRQLCDTYFLNHAIRHSYLFFRSAEEVLEYCRGAKERVDLLFLDVEMPGMSGIELKEQILKQDSIWRIVFVSGHPETVFMAFGLKTLDFIIKPPSQEKISKWIRVVLEEAQEDALVEIQGFEGEDRQYLRLEDIMYIKAERNYSRIVLHNPLETEKLPIICRQIGEWEKVLPSNKMIRVHKSYLVNVMNIISIADEIKLRDIDDSIPIGRRYREQVKEQYQNYIKNTVRKRLK